MYLSYHEDPLTVWICNPIASDFWYNSPCCLLIEPGHSGVIGPVFHMSYWQVLSGIILDGLCVKTTSLNMIMYQNRANFVMVLAHYDMLLGQCFTDLLTYLKIYKYTILKYSNLVQSFKVTFPNFIIYIYENYYCHCFLLSSQPFWYHYWNILGEKRQYYDCRCPGSFCCQVISSYGIAHAGQIAVVSHDWGKVSTTCAILMSTNWLNKIQIYSMLSGNTWKCLLRLPVPSVMMKLVTWKLSVFSICTQFRCALFRFKSTYANPQKDTTIFKLYA